MNCRIFTASILLSTTLLFSADMVTYAGGGGRERFNCGLVLSDGTVLVGGQAQDLDWLPAGVTKTQISADTINSASAGNIGFILHLSADLATILRAVHFPAGTVRDVRRIRTASIPGQPTGDLYISGSRDNATSHNGYYIAKLDANFVTAPPTALAWSYDVNCRDAGDPDHKVIQPWDVGGDGSVVFATSQAYGYDWASIEKLDGNGNRVAVQGGHGEDPMAIAMKGYKQDLRSVTRAGYDSVIADGNGGLKKGLWPNDYYHAGPSGETDNGPGYTGYRRGDKHTPRIGAIAVDRRNNHFYFGYSQQSRLPDGNPDFEPAVVAMDDRGELKWWSRCYAEWIDRDSSGVLGDADAKTSSPDQYIDDLAVDYVSPPGGALVVAARCHGNNVINYWNGSEVRYAGNPGDAFQNRFSGTNGNIHISWIGVFSLDKEELRYATYLAELNAGQNPGGSYDDPLLAGWYSLNSGWPDLNTTKVTPNSMAIDDAGNICVIASGRQTITTTNAFQQMVKPGDGAGCWNAFVRVYRPDLALPLYSSLVVGNWDRSTGAGGANTVLAGVVATAGGVMALGYQSADSAGNPTGSPVPVTGVPSWGASAPQNESAVLAKLEFERPAQVIAGSPADRPGRDWTGERSGRAMVVDIGGRIVRSGRDGAGASGVRVVIVKTGRRLVMSGAGWKAP